MYPDLPCHAVLIRKLGTRAPLDDEDREALRALPCAVRELAPQSYMTREGSRPLRCAFLVSGFAMRHKLAADGGRQIVAVLLPGDLTDMQQLFVREADHNVQTLTRVTFADFAVQDLRTIAMARTNIARALWIDALIEASITRETVLNIGRRDAATRLAHILCEFETPLAAAGLADQGFELPLTQEQIGDATGLTAVHVNRTLRDPTNEGLIARNKRSVQIVDWTGLRRRADFNPRYLHLDESDLVN